MKQEQDSNIFFVISVYTQLVGRQSERLRVIVKFSYSQANIQSKTYYKTNQSAQTSCLMLVDLADDRSLARSPLVPVLEKGICSFTDL